MTKSIFAVAILFLTNGSLSLACDEWPDDVVLLRHAEKSDPSDPDSALSAVGWCMAGDLPKVLAGKNITAIFVTDKKRTQQTARSLGEYTGTTPTILPKGHHDALMAAICGAGKSGQTETVVVIGHESTVPRVMEDLGVAKVTPAYGDLFTVIPFAGRTDRSRFGDCCN
jgi:phosphohistidine phosphatase SixA